MTTFNWIILAITLLGWAVTYGKFCQKVVQMDKDSAAHSAELAGLRLWCVGEFIRKDVYEAKHCELERNLKELAELKLPATLARIEANQETLIVDVSKMQITLQQLLERGGK
jgi:hypothetical protein